MNNHEFMDQATAKLKEVWAKLEAYDKISQKPPNLYFNLRSRRCAGLANGGYIRLNLAFVPKNGEDMIAQTVPHEAVHSWLALKGADCMKRSYDMYSMRRSRRSPHGPEFMFYLGSVLGCEAKRTHNYDSAEAARQLGRKTFKAHCSYGCTFNLSTQMRNKIARGSGHFCKKHRSTLVLD